jgi:hypothetical protein
MQRSSSPANIHQSQVHKPRFIGFFVGLKDFLSHPMWAGQRIGHLTQELDKKPPQPKPVMETAGQGLDSPVI